MTSAVSICSNALLSLGDSPISDFNEANDRTRLVANLYAYKRDRVLRLHPWNCATKRVILSPDTDIPPFDWAYQFQLPDDWLRTVGVGLKTSPDEFLIEDRKILMNTNICRLRYIWRNDVEESWDALLVDAMTQVMISALTYAITKSTTKQASEEQIVQMVLKTARSVNGQEQPAQTLGDSPLLSHRMS
jgi:hypothetical protein